MEKTPPTVKEIDSLARMYDEAKKAVDTAQETADMFADQLIEMVEQFGCIAPRAEKTRQIQGQEWLAKVTQGQSVQVDNSQVLQLRRLLASLSLSRLFKKLFAIEERYMLCEGAQEFVSRENFLVSRQSSACVSRVRIAFSACIKVKTNSPRLKVEPLKKDKE